VKKAKFMYDPPNKLPKKDMNLIQFGIIDEEEELEIGKIYEIPDVEHKHLGKLIDRLRGNGNWKEVTKKGPGRPPNTTQNIEKEED